MRGASVKRTRIYFHSSNIFLNMYSLSHYLLTIQMMFVFSLAQRQNPSSIFILTIQNILLCMIYFFRRKTKHKLYPQSLITMPSEPYSTPSASTAPQNHEDVVKILKQNEPLSLKKFTLGEIIGEGTFSSVCAVKIEGSPPLALKIIRKDMYIKSTTWKTVRSISNLLWERNILQNISHPFITQLFIKEITNSTFYRD